MLFCTFRYRTAAHLHFMEAAAAQLDVRRISPRSRIARIAFIAIVVALSSVGADAQVRTDPQSGVVAPEVAFVQSGGTWEAGTRYGYYRLVVTTVGFEHLRSTVRLEWFEYIPDSGSVRLVAFAALDSAFALDSLALDAYSIGMPSLSSIDGTWRVRLEGTHSHSLRRAWWEIELGPPGRWKLTRASPREPPNGGW